MATSNAEARRAAAERELEAAEAAVTAGEAGAADRLTRAEAALEEVSEMTNPETQTRRDTETPRGTHALPAVVTQEPLANTTHSDTRKQITTTYIEREPHQQ